MFKKLKVVRSLHLTTIVTQTDFNSNHLTQFKCISGLSQLNSLIIFFPFLGDKSYCKDFYVGDFVLRWWPAVDACDCYKDCWLGVTSCSARCFWYLRAIYFALFITDRSFNKLVFLNDRLLL